MIGKNILHYKIIEKLGEGGMGVVYKAEDTKLERIVALKFLPSHMTVSETDRERFHQEAKAAAALNHPNVCVIHDIQEYEDPATTDSAGKQQFIVMEYVDGQTLRMKINEENLNIDESVNIAVQIGEGLLEAHNKGIVHRDIKSDNIMINTSNQVKIMDFGLAKLKGSLKLTRSSSTIGTLAYMAPEQIQGREVDARSDIFSFGVLLYEMLSGVVPFKGDYESAIMYAILNEEPEPIQKHIPELSPEFLHVLNRALEKNPEDRYQSLKDMLIDLRRLKRDSSKVTQKSLEMMEKSASLEKPAPEMKQKESKKGWKTLFVYSAIAAIVLSVLTIAFYFLNNKKSTYVPASHKQITFTGGAYNPEISPDGNFVAYISKNNPESQVVMVQDMTGGQPLRVFEEKEIERCLWTPDGSELSIKAWNDSSFNHYLIPRLGGEVRRLNYVPVFCWSPDGSRYAGSSLPGKRIWFVNKQSADTSSIALNGAFTFFRDIDWSPKGDFLLFLTNYQKGNTIWTIKADGSKQQKVLEDSVKILSPRWSNRGDAIYYLRSRGQEKDLMKIKIDPSYGIAEDKPEILQSGIPIGSVISLSKDNKKLLYTRETVYSNLKLIRQRNGEQKINSLTEGTLPVFSPSISPDGKKVAFSMGSKENANIFVIPLEGGEKKQLTFFNSFNDFPVWSPDGKKIAFGSNQGGQSKVWIIAATGGTPRPFKNSVLSSSDLVVWAPAKEILYQRPGNRNFHFLDPQTEKEKPLVPNDSMGWIFDPQYSPDKQNIAVFWNRKEKGKRMAGIWLISRVDSSQKFLYPERSWPVGWSSDSEWTYISNYEKTGEILKLRVSDGKVEPFVTLPFKKIDSITMTEDGKKIICSVIDKKSDVWIMENFDPGLE